MFCRESWGKVVVGGASLRGRVVSISYYWSEDGRYLAHVAVIGGDYHFLLAGPLVGCWFSGYNGRELSPSLFCWPVQSGAPAPH